MFNLNTNPEQDRKRAAQGHRRELIALLLLVAALAVVMVKNHDFWFGSDEEFESDATQSESVHQAKKAAAPAKTEKSTVARALTSKNHPASKTATTPAVPETTSKDASNSEAPAVVTNRAVLPPLDIEVVAGDKHSTVHAGSNVTKVEIPSDSTRVPASASSVAPQPTNAAVREPLTSMGSLYPLLGQHMKVQGSVILQAVVGVDGTIQNLRVVSGPAILTAAAQQAVREWHFKPYLLNGQAVETKATITVNFSIRVSDNAAKTS
jgi:TonB family protein